MSPRYLVRFDDIAPAMDWGRWEQVEAVLREVGARPILAVVPDCRDPHLAVGPAVDDFWDRVRAWQADGWAIGLHGHQHRYTTTDGGILGLNPASEFAGVAAAEQRSRLGAGLDRFAAEGVTVDAWVAPGHSFDATTVRLLLEAGVDVVSDGFGVRAGRQPDGAVWVPQQLWRFRPRPLGTWTVCYHTNPWTDDDLARFAADLRANAGRLVDLRTVVDEARGRRLTRLDRAVAAGQRRALLARRSLVPRLQAALPRRRR